jgi:Flp pilus assembly protein TadD
MTDVDWLPGLAMLAAGLVIGTVLVWRVYATARSPAPSSAPALPVRDLAGKRDALFQQLRELEDTASKRTPEQLAHERYALELAAAEVLRELDRAAAASVTQKAPAPAPPAAGAAPPVAAAAPAPPGAGAAMRGFLWGTGSMAAVGLLLFFVTESAKERKEGGSLTGNTPREETTGAAQPDAELAQLQQAVRSSPDDVEARLDLARAHLARQDLMAVFNETKNVLDRAPGHPRALAYQALVRLAMGQAETSVQMLKQALATEPDFLEGYVDLVLVYVRMGRDKDAEATMAEALERFPDQEKALNRLYGEIRAQGRDEAATAGEEDPHVRVSPPQGVASGRPAGAPTAPAKGSERSVAGQVDLDPALKAQVGARGVLFVMLRPEGFGAGPPLAAKRIADPSFPVAFRIGEADAMMGQELPDRVLIEARLDGDGDPTTRDPKDPYGRLDEVAVGTADARVVLKRR